LGAALLFFAMLMSFRIEQPKKIPAEVEPIEPSPIVGPSV
jgi:hypothetical protein